MKKRLLAMSLSLVLCFGLAVPAFAEEEVLRDPLPSLSFDLPDGHTASAKTDTYQIRYFEEKLADGVRYSYTYNEEPDSEEITCTAIPLGTGITMNGVGGLSALPGEPAASGKVLYSYNTHIRAYSDPDGDDVFDERIFYLDSDGNVGWDTYSVAPVTEKGPFAPPDDDWSRYLTSADPRRVGFETYSSYHDTSIAVTTSDILYEVFGPNTLIQVEASLAGVADSEWEEVGWFLLTGEAAPPAVMVNATDLGGDIFKEDMEFTLRNITEEFFPDNRFAAIHTDFTRDEETEAVELKDVPTLTAEGFLRIYGIKAVSDEQEAWAGVSLSAWSDPDSDGVYDQQLFTCYGATDSIYMVPLSQPGPFTFYEVDYREGMPGYSRSANICGTDKLTSRPYSSGETPSSLTLSGNYLTWLFGPDTLVKIQPVTAERFENGSPAAEEGPAYYCYIPEDAAAVPAFNDVPVWCQPAVYWAKENEITTGTSYTQFSPERNCTHAMILTFLWRAAGELDAQAPCPVTLPASLKYAEDALRWAAEKGMIDKTLDPTAYCTRADAVNYIWQAFGKEAASASSFNDVSASAAYAPAVNWAVANGIVEGYPDGAFHPDTVCNRGVIVTMLHRAYVPEARLSE